MIEEVRPLLESEAQVDALEQFRLWYDEALTAGFVEPTAMALATADAAGSPSLRMVLLKEYGINGFVFYTNYTSRKGEDLAANPRAALLLWWDKLFRQVRVEGAVEKVSDEISDAYFRTRPAGSQLSAVVSPQSQVIGNRDELETSVLELAKKYEGRDVPRPAEWGGYCVKPETIEFWQGRRDRLHDRLQYKLEGTGWKRLRLAP
jgi:pyridoxamine 5'-phosphate oxidase